MNGFEQFPVVAQPDPAQDPWAAFPPAETPVQSTGLAGTVEEALGGLIPPPVAPATPAAPSAPFSIGGTGASLADGVREGVAMMLGAPVDIVNNAPRLANLLPGVDGVGPITDEPIGGRQTIDMLLRLGGLVPDRVPENGAERIANRTGREIGATLVPAAGALAGAAAKGTAAVNRMAATPTSLGESLAGQFLQPAAVAPGQMAAREGSYALASGLGAGVANEVAGENAGVVSDLAGSLTGALGLGIGNTLLGGARNAVAAATGNPAYLDDMMRENIAKNLVANSTHAGERLARDLPLDMQPLADQLRMRAPVEDAVPGYVANIADRSGDPALAAFTYNTDTAFPGAANARRVANDAAVGDTMAAIAPDGNPARFRGDLQSAVDQKITAATSEADLVRQMFDEQALALQPGMADATARGSSIRSGVADAYGRAKGEVDALYGALDTTTPVDPRPLIERGAAVDASLAPNDAKRFRPAEADTILGMTPDAPVPLSDVMATRSGLTDDVRAARAAGQRQAARVGDQYRMAIDDFLEQSLPPAERTKLDTARAARRDVADRFERPGTGLARTLGPREGGGYALDDSAVPGVFAQSDQGNLTDLRSLLREAGTDQGVRDGLADQVRSEVVSRGLLDKPQQLGAYIAQRNTLLSEFPELRTQLEQAGATRAQLDAADKAAKTLSRDLTTPGRSPEASYLRYGDDRSLDAVRTLVNASDPRAATRQLVDAAGTPTARADLRAALWQEVRNRGQMSAGNSSGGTRWNGRQARDLFNDPKFAAVADELWSDDPEDLANIRQVFDALAGAEGSTRAKAPASSGTAQALSGKYDPALTSASIASRVRNVQRGVVSAPITAVDLISTWLRRRAGQVHARAIDQITASVVNNPGLAADLLERYNPATAGAYKRMLTQKWGVRATSIINVLDEAGTEDPVTDALEEQQ